MPRSKKRGDTFDFAQCHGERNRTMTHRARLFSFRAVLFGGAVFAAGLAGGVFGGKFLESLLSNNKDFSNPRYFPKDTSAMPARRDIEKALAKAQRELEVDPSDIKALTVSGIAYFALG